MILGTKRFFLVPVAALGAILLSAHASAQVNIFTSFEPAEFPLGSVDFTLGTPPDSAHFTGGVTLTVGIPNAYRSGIASWGILNTNGVGVIDFDNPASLVSMWVINANGATGVVNVYNQADVLIGSMPVVGNDMMNGNSYMEFTPGDFGDVEIGKVEVMNSGGAGHQVWVDDFGATVNTPVPEPATLIVLASGLAIAAARRRKRLA